MGTSQSARRWGISSHLLQNSCSFESAVRSCAESNLLLPGSKAYINGATQIQDSNGSINFWCSDRFRLTSSNKETSQNQIPLIDAMVDFSLRNSAKSHQIIILDPGTLWQFNIAMDKCHRNCEFSH